MNAARSSPSGRIANRLLRGDGLLLDPSGTLDPLSRPSRFYEWDYFLESITSPRIGRMKWSLLGSGSPTIASFNWSSLISPRIRIDTSANANDRACLVLGETEARTMCTPLEFENVSIIWRAGTPITNKRAFFGWSDDFSLDPLAANNALGINFDAQVSPGFQLISRAGGITIAVEDAQLASLPDGIGSQLQAVTIVQSSTGRFDFYSNQFGSEVMTAIGSLESPGFAANHGFRSETLAAVSERMDIAFWAMNSEELGGLFASDDQLDLS
jgi:hypothetical protein